MLEISSKLVFFHLVFLIVQNNSPEIQNKITQEL